MLRFGLLLVVSVVAACATVDPALIEKRSRAQSAFDGGNFIDAALGYSELAEAEKRGSAHQREAQRRWALSLYRAGEHDYARQALGSIDRGRLGDRERREVTLALAGSALHEAREKNPILMERNAENKNEYDQRRDEAIELFQRANQHYSELLKRDPNDYEGNLGRAECYLRLAELQDVSDFLRTADRHLRTCEEQRAGDIRCVFLRVRVDQENLGLALRNPMTQQEFRDLEPSAATDLISALRQDRALSYDFHEAYRDVYLYVRNFRSSAHAAEAQRADGTPATSAVRRERVDALVELLDGYQREGRKPESEWGQESVRRIREFVRGYQQRSADGTHRNVEQAERIARERQDTEGLAEALALLEAVDPEFRGNDEYVNVRTKVQTALVKSLHTRAKRLIELQEWERAEACLQQSASALEDEEWWDSLEGRPGDTLGAITDTHSHLREVRRNVEQLDTIESLMRRGDIQTARRQLDELVVPATAQDLERRLEGLKMAAERQEVASRIVELQEMAEGLRREGRAQEAVPPLQEALGLAQGSAWRDRIVRDLSEIHYERGEFEQCIDVLHEFEREFQDDLLLGKCYYHTGRFDVAKGYFVKVQELGLYSDVDPESLALGGLAYYQAADYEAARNLLGRYRTRMEGVDVPAEVQDALLDSARHLYAQWRLAADREQRRDEATELLTLILDLDPDDHAHRLQMGLQRYQAAVAQNRVDLFERAYDDIVRATAGGETLQTEEELEIFGRLTACFGDLMPLAKGNTWSYTGPDEELVLQIQGDYLEDRQGYPLNATLIRGAQRELSSGIVRRKSDVIERVFDLGRREQYPIPLRAPTTENQGIVYSSNKARFRSTVTETGIHLTVNEREFANCVRVVIEQIDETGAAVGAPTDELILAPGVGIVEWKKGERRYLLRAFEVM